MPVFPELTLLHWCDSFSPDGTKFCYLGRFTSAYEVYAADFPFQSQVVSAINQLIEEIDELVANGDLSYGIGNSLISKLNGAIKSINDGNLISAINKLEAFIHQVEALSGKKLSAVQADEFIEKKRNIIAVLSKQATAVKPNIPANRGAKKESVSAGLYFLEQNSPNPFNPSTTISFTVPSGSNDPVVLNIYDIRGSLVRRLVNESKSSGVQSVVWDGNDDSGRSVSAGIYFCRMQAGRFSKTNKMILLR